MTGLEVTAAVNFGKALYGLKCRYDLVKENQHEIKELQDFIEEFEALLPNLRHSFRQCKGNPAGDSALQLLEEEIIKATRAIQRMSTSSTFFMMLTAPQRLKEISKLHQSLMMAMQKHMSIASISMLLDIRTGQANLQGDLKSLLISGMADMSQTVAREVRIAASEASQGSYADEKFWADVLGALEASKDANEDIPERYLDPILADVMVDPVLASNGVTYCRWTILDNHMTKDPHNPNENLTILGDNVSLRSELFGSFPELSCKFRERRSAYRSEALSLATRGRLADAMVGLQHVLRWDKKDSEVLAALARVQAAMKDVKSRQAPKKVTGAPPKMVLPKVTSSDCVVPDSSTSSSVGTAQMTLHDSGAQKTQTSTKSVPPTNPQPRLTASSAAAALQKPERPRSRSSFNHPPPRRPPPLTHPIPLSTEPERRLARPPIVSTTQGDRAHLGQERPSLYQHGQGLQIREDADYRSYGYSAEVIPTPIQQRQQHSVQPAQESSTSVSEAKSSGPSKWKTGLKVSLAVAGALTGVGPILGAYKEIANLQKGRDDGSKMKTVKHASEDTREYYDGYGDPQAWNGAGHMVEGYTSHRYESSNYPDECEEFYDQSAHGRNYGEEYPHSENPTSHCDGGHTGHWRDHAYSMEGHDYNQQVQENNQNSADQHAYSGCTSEEALRRHLARKHL